MRRKIKRPIFAQWCSLMVSKPTQHPTSLRSGYYQADIVSSDPGITLYRTAKHKMLYQRTEHDKIECRTLYH